MPLDADMTGVVVVATLNEGVVLRGVLEEISEAAALLAPFGWNLRVVIVDDSADERVVELVDSHRSVPELPVELVRGPHSGLGAAILTGFDHALRDRDVGFVVNLDGDGQHDGRQIGDLLRSYRNHGGGIVIGSRWAKGGTCYGLSFGRKILSRVGSIVLRSVGVPWHVKDPTTSFRVYSRSVVESIGRDLLGFDGYSFFGAAIALAHSNGFSINEVPIVFRPRVLGESKLSGGQISAAAKDVVTIRRQAAMVRMRTVHFSRDLQVDAPYSASRELELLSSSRRSAQAVLDALHEALGPTVIEVGAGLGQNAQVLVEQGRSVLAVEPDESLCARLRALEGPNCHVVNCRLADLEGSDRPEPPSTIFYINVLEHIEDDVAELETAAGLMSAATRLAIFVPANPGLYGSMDWISGHYRRYRRDELIRVVERAGLEVERIGNFDHAGVYAYWLLYHALKRRRLGASTVSLYERLVLPLATFEVPVLGRLFGYKNLFVIAKLPSGDDD